MSFLTKLFLLLSILTGLCFVVVAGALVAKQENFEARYAKELIERKRDERLQELQRHHLAALKDSNRRQVLHERTRTLVATGAAQVATSEQQRVEDALEEVTAAVRRFNHDFGFDDVTRSYETSLGSLVDNVNSLAERRNEVVADKATLQTHLTNAEVEIGRLRESLNVLDYNFYELRRSNQEFREVVRLYLEADDTLSARGFGGPTRPSGRIDAVDADLATVVINVGANEEVQPNQVFSVISQRSGEFVAEIEVTDVFEMSSTARINTRTQRGAINVDDMVRPRATTAGY